MSNRSGKGSGARVEAHRGGLVAETSSKDKERFEQEVFYRRRRYLIEDRAKALGLVLD